VLRNFVICHDQKIADNSKLNKTLPNLKWVMVGNKKFSSGIIARKLKKNIENHPYLVAYTAWYALVHNGYIDDETYYGIFEYDIKVDPHFAGMIMMNLKPKQIIGFIPYSVESPLFMGHGTELLKQSIKDVYNVDVDNLVQKEILTDRRLWCSTSNCIIQGKDMKAFVDWFDKLIPLFKRSPMAAHYPERAIRLWIAINDMSILCSINLFYHEQKKSHKIEFAIH
jgi:hypothetical protein